MVQKSVKKRMPKKSVKRSPKKSVKKSPKKSIKKSVRRSPFEKHSKVGCVLPPYIEIKDSTIEGSGKGAFAKCDIPANKYIGEYLGKILKGKDADKGTGGYLFDASTSAKNPYIIDGKIKKYASWVRFINTPQTAAGGNAEFKQSGNRIYIKTTKVIPAGHEIFAFYGPDYVNNMLKQYFTKENRPRISTRKAGIKC